MVTKWTETLKWLESQLQLLIAFFRKYKHHFKMFYYELKEDFEFDAMEAFIMIGIFSALGIAAVCLTATGGLLYLD